MDAEWKKQGLLFRPEDRLSWMSTHAQMPIANFLDDTRVRIYFSTRDQNNQTFPAYFETDLREPTKILALSEKPLLELGPPGSFDDKGVMPSCLVSEGDLMFLYYIGWNVSETVPFRNAIGIATSSDGGKSFRKISVGPILDRSQSDPYFVTTPFVLKEGERWQMWYASGTNWKKEPNGKLRSYYNIRHAESKDGRSWIPSPGACLDFEENECAVARPCVLRENGHYRMWFCSRWDDYHIGYAESRDGISWVREKSTLRPSPSGWDSGMTAYPFVQPHMSNMYHFYNGNEFGKTGIGYAIASI